MMDHLGAKEGQEMKFEHVDLPKGQFVRLQPVSSAWLVSTSMNSTVNREYFVVKIFSDSLAYAKIKHTKIHT